MRRAKIGPVEMAVVWVRAAEVGGFSVAIFSVATFVA